VLHEQKNLDIRLKNELKLNDFTLEFDALGVDDESIPPVTIYLYDFKYKWQIVVSKLLPDFLNKFIFKKYLKIMTNCELKSADIKTDSDNQKIEITFEYKEIK
jgi:hypothetical protein